MLSAHLAAIGGWLTYPCCLCLCLAALLRAAASLRSPDQRGLWLAVATAGLAMTLDLPAVTGAATRLLGTDHTVDLVRNLTGVVSAGAALFFVSAPSRSRRLRTGLCAVVAAVLIVLTVLDLSAPAHTAHSVTAAGGPTPSSAYWLTLISTHMVSDSVCVVVCCWYALRTDDRPLATALWLFAAGTALAALFWIGRLLLLFEVRWALPYLPLLINLHAFLRAAAILAPTAVVLARTLADARTVWRLWPLWRELVGAVPHVVLTRRGTRLLELLWPPVPRGLLAYRKLIEIRDAMLELDHYVPPGLPVLARERVRPLGLPPAQADAMALACVMKEARRAKLAGRPRYDSPGESFLWNESPAPLTRQEHATALTAEKTHLVALARAYASAPAFSFPAQGRRPGTETTAGRAGADGKDDTAEDGRRRESHRPLRTHA
ncbi:MAB_1171c family putative transporter [Streptomyces sp. NPDC093249]|uniref:MAB_1171c family putative transporter n=1 Tax=unclassified Streptomyces TaxID=2593676 RepID=UPI003815CFE6